MGALRLLLCFLSLIASVTAIQCYVQAVTGKTKPSRTLNCESVEYCTKSVADSNDVVVRSYGCTDGLCLGNGCYSPTEGVTLCCCDTELCNSSSSLALFSTFVSVIFVKLFTL